MRQGNAEWNKSISSQIKKRLETHHFISTSEVRQNRDVEQENADILHQLTPDRDGRRLREELFPYAECHRVWVERVHLSAHEVAIDGKALHELIAVLADERVDPLPR